MKIDEIPEPKKQNPHAKTRELKTAIDELVYKLYNLTDDEIKIVQGEQNGSL
ncbi:MAG: hypothetical protein NTZ60_05810 [Campylobacterales bacterium]|nr:hypothetical protein [Campylobacterales bacterium]